MFSPTNTLSNTLQVVNISDVMIEGWWRRNTRPSLIRWGGWYSGYFTRLRFDYFQKWYVHKTPEILLDFELYSIDVIVTFIFHNVFGFLACACICPVVAFFIFNMWSHETRRFAKLQVILFLLINARSFDPDLMIRLYLKALENSVALIF